jgi:hypothetical protein
MSDLLHILSPASQPLAQGELRLSDLVNAVSTYATSDPGPDPTFDEDPIPSAVS